MRFLIVNGSLKPPGNSNTHATCVLFKQKIVQNGHNCDLINMHEGEYAPTTEWRDDLLGDVINAMIVADGIVFATPIWWGGVSSHIQALLERLDTVYVLAKREGYQPFYNKTFGCVISGGGDGFQAIEGRLFSFAAALGLTVVPGCNVESRAQRSVARDKPTVEQVAIATTNMVAWTHALMTANPARDANHDSVDINALKTRK